MYLSIVVTLTFEVFARKLIQTGGWVTEEDIENHARVIRKLCFGGHRNIVRVFSEGYVDIAQTTYYLDMELCSSTLYEYIKGVGYWQGKCDYMTAERKLCQIFDIMSQLSEALRFIHSHNEVHRDINIYLL